MYHFKPTFWASLCTFVSCIVLIYLGTWQMERLEWKRGILTQIEQYETNAPRSIETVENWDDADYMNVTVTGEYLHEHEIYLRPRVYKKRLGFHVITPLKTQTGRIVFVNRGWSDVVDFERSKNEAAVQGKVRGPFKTNMFTPDNLPERGSWYYIDIDQMAEHAGFDLKDVYPSILYADEAKALPVGGQLIVKIPNNHLQYAWIWFSMMGILLVIYTIYHMKPTDTDKDDT